MAPQQSIPVAADVLGTIGTILWCVQLVPQIWTNWRTKQTDGLPSAMMFLWALCGVPFGVYSIVQKFNVPVQVQPQVFMALCLVSWAQTLVYHSHWRPWTAMLTAFTTACIFAGVETALILTVTVSVGWVVVAPLSVWFMKGTYVCADNKRWWFPIADLRCR